MTMSDILIVKLRSTSVLTSISEKGKLFVDTEMTAGEPIAINNEHLDDLIAEIEKYGLEVRIQ